MELVRINMKNLLMMALLLSLASCDTDDDMPPSNFIQVNIEGTNYTFIGRSIYEPLSLINDTLKNTTYLGGFIGTCLESTQFIDIRINQTAIGEYELSDGIEFWMETENHSFIANNRSENHYLSLTISEYGDENERIKGIFSGTNTSNNQQVTLTGEFSLERLPDYNVTLAVVSELCK